jgi:hypothetical protein
MTKVQAFSWAAAVFCGIVAVLIAVGARDIFIAIVPSLMCALNVFLAIRPLGGRS